MAGDDRLEVDAAARRERDRGRVGVRVAERARQPDLAVLDQRRAGPRRSPPGPCRRAPPCPPAAAPRSRPPARPGGPSTRSARRPRRLVAPAPPGRRVAPVRRASASRGSLTSEISTWVAPNASATCIASSPIGPAPVTSTRSPALTPALRHAQIADRQRLHQRADVVGQRVGQREREVLVDRHEVRERAVDRAAWRRRRRRGRGCSGRRGTRGSARTARRARASRGRRPRAWSPRRRPPPRGPRTRGRARAARARRAARSGRARSSGRRSRRRRRT